jgi:hypothetical protein
MRNCAALCSVALALQMGCGDDEVERDAAPDFDATPMQSASLAYDDGTVDEPFSVFGDSAGAQVAVRFTPPAYPAHVESVEVFVAGGFGVPTTVFGVQVYAESSNTGLPGAALLSQPVDAAADEGDTWVSVDLAGRGAVVEQDEFFVAVEWLTAPGSSGQNAQFIGADLSSPDRRSYYTEAGEVVWERITRFTGGHDLDFMIRATVAHP